MRGDERLLAGRLDGQPRPHACPCSGPPKPPPAVAGPCLATCRVDIMTDEHRHHRAQHAHAEPSPASAHDHDRHVHENRSDGADTVKDPVCGMTVDPHTASYRAEHNGHPYSFCSAGCRSKFVADPDRYIDPATTPA